MMDIPHIMFNSLVISLICLILFQASREGNVLYPLRMLIEVVFQFIPKMEMFHKPFFGCLTCMCSVWGTIYYFTIYQGSGIKEYLLLVLIAGAFNFILELLTVLIETLILINKHESFHWPDASE